MNAFNESIIRQFRENGGEVESPYGRRLVLLHDRGAVSGDQYVHPVASVQLDDGSWLICASASGRDRAPAWYGNLVAHPDLDIETPDGPVAVHMEELAGSARSEAWERFIGEMPNFAEYQRKTSRILPVLHLTRRSG